MPKRKSVKIRKQRQVKTINRITKKATEKRSFPWGESYINLLLGIIFIIIVILFVGSLIKVKHTRDITSTSTVAPIPSLTPSPSPYIVQSGDDLWTIAEKVYNDGFKWVEIAKANNITNPSTIYKGDKLIIPVLITPTSEQTIISNNFPTQQQRAANEQKNIPDAITGTEYTVQRGDNLWNISVRAYADGFRWVDIAKANNLANPGLIHAGNVFRIPR